MTRYKNQIAAMVGAVLIMTASFTALALAPPAQAAAPAVAVPLA